MEKKGKNETPKISLTHKPNTNVRDDGARSPKKKPIQPPKR